MATLFAMPKLGMNMEEGVLVGWLVPEGSEVRTGQPILEIETDKTTVELEATADGVLALIVRSAGDTVPINGVLAVILSPGEALPNDIPDSVV
ncbi:MAG TPA: biotin/lipoyl-containing protein [Candidatus Limnocylindrales bacterium]|nr:biotin/lipoyl-containing protein [Candidatus Limnocylindrales bacterium]